MRWSVAYSMLTILRPPIPIQGAKYPEFHMQKLAINDLGFDQNYHTFAVILLMKIVLCSKFHRSRFMNYKFAGVGDGGNARRAQEVHPRHPEAPQARQGVISHHMLVGDF